MRRVEVCCGSLLTYRRFFDGFWFWIAGVVLICRCDCWLFWCSALIPFCSMILALLCVGKSTFAID